MDRASAEAVFKQVFRLSTADETQVSLEASRSAVARFARGALSQLTAESDAVLEIRAAVRRRVGTVSTNDLSPAGLARAVDWVLAAARQQPEKADWPGFPEPRPIQPIAAFDDAVAGAAPQRLAGLAGDICRRAAAEGLLASGTYSLESGAAAVANSRGVLAYHPYTDVDLTLVMESAHGSGYAHGASWNLDGVDPQALGAEAMTRARRARPPRRVEPGEYPVVLEPYAVLSLAEALAEAGMGALAVQEGRSWMSGRIGRAVFAPQLSIWDDGLDLAGSPMPFDCEGVPKRRVDIVRGGVPAGPVYDTLTAAREPGGQSTGHAQPYDDDWDGPAPENLVMAPGEASLDEMIAGLDRGLYVTRFWYANLLSERDCAVTGVTRDGVWWIEAGELRYPAANLRFTQRLLPALKRVRAVAREQKTLRGAFGTHRLPGMALDAFRFVPPVVAGQEALD